jgi:hypothetical protein
VQIEAVKKCVREEMAIGSTLFVFGAYGIGKERVYMSVAEEHNMKVTIDCQSPSQRNVLLRYRILAM